VISRVVVILLAFGASAYRAWQGALLEAGGLAALGLGLVLLRAAGRRPALARAAWLCFLVTAAVIVSVIIRDYL
jgi:hypothetical protein